MLVTKREPVSKPRVVGLSVAVIGASFFFASVGGAEGGVSGNRLAGDLIFLAGAICWAAYTILSKSLLQGTDALQATAVGTVAGALGLLLVALPSLPGAQWDSVSSTTWVNVIYLAVGPTALAYLFYYRGLKHVTPTAATLMMFAVPIFGTLCATIFLGEQFTFYQLLASILTIAGALLAVTNGRFPFRNRLTRTADH